MECAVYIIITLLVYYITLFRHTHPRWPHRLASVAAPVAATSLKHSEAVVTEMITGVMHPISCHMTCSCFVISEISRGLEVICTWAHLDKCLAIFSLCIYIYIYKLFVFFKSLKFNYTIYIQMCLIIITLRLVLYLVNILIIHW